MAGSFWSLLTLLAEGDAPAEGAGGPAGLANMLLPLVAIFIIFYFLLMRPQRREQAKREAMVKAIKANDRVVTVGGIYGIVANVNQAADSVTLKIDESNNTKIRVTLGAIARVITDESSNETPK
jgi:preprotein translocase subunit YajC